MNNYTKLFQSILASSIWSEDDQTRIVWITLLAMADKHGEVHASVPGVARLAGVPIAATETALQRFLSPDPYSRTPDNEGRRLLPMEGGWRIANHAKYRLMASREDEKTKTAARVAAHRAKRGGSGDDVGTKRGQSGESVTHRYTPLQGVTDLLQQGAGNGGVTQSLHIAEAEAEAEAKTNPIDVSTPQAEGGVGETPKALQPAGGGGVLIPTRKELEARAAMIGLPLREVDKFEAHYGANGWTVAGTPMASWAHAMVKWKLKWEEINGHGNAGQRSSGRPTAAEQRKALIAGADATQRQAELTAERERREQQDPDWVPI